MARAQERFNEQIANGGLSAYSRHGARQLVARYHGKCLWCLGPIQPGEAVWLRQTDIREYRHDDCYTDWQIYSYDIEHGIVQRWMDAKTGGWKGNRVEPR